MNTKSLCSVLLLSLFIFSNASFTSAHAGHDHGPKSSGGNGPVVPIERIENPLAGPNQPRNTMTPQGSDIAYQPYVAPAKIESVYAQASNTVASAPATPTVLGESTTKCTPHTLPVLTQGARGAEVLMLQSLLNTYGPVRVPETGYFGKRTLASLRAFQKANSLADTGTLTPETLARLTTIACR